jgi:photosystem II stability/assembly factor-like uncharacterized protein
LNYRLLLPLLILTTNAAMAAPVPPTSFQDLRWRLLGPMRGGWSIEVAGVPDAIDTFYFGGADGGVWRTNDAGLTWRPISDGAGFSSVGAMAVVPTAEADGKRGRVIYVGSGQIQTRYDVMDGNGIWKSSDDGATWTSLGLADTRHIGRLWVDPRDAKVVLVAALGHLYGPNDERGIFRTDDGGATWQRVAFVDQDTGAADLAADPAEPNRVYASFWQVRRYPWQGYHVPQSGPGSGIWRSRDGGRSWQPTPRQGLPTAPMGRISLAVAPGTDGQRVYASVDCREKGGLYRSDDGGDSWQLVNPDRSIPSTYMGHVFSDPRSADIVWVVGQSLRRSDDGGATLHFVKGAPGGDDYHFFWINPQHLERMAVASDQGTAVTVNGGETWSPWYNQPTGQFYRLGADDRFPYWVYSGQQDSGTVAIATRSDYGQLTFRDWHPVGGDERDGDLPDPEDPRYVYGSGLGGRLSRWDAETGRVANVAPWPIGSYGRDPRTARYRTTWITPIAVSSRAPHALYWGTQFLFRSLDKGASWQQMSPDLSGADPAAPGCDGVLAVERATLCGYGVIFAIAPSPAADGVIWVGTDNGRVQLTRDDGKTWVDVTPPEVADWSQIASVDTSASDPATAYLAVNRRRLDDQAPYVYVTHDFGASWRRADGGLPPGEPVNVVRQDPVAPSLLYAGTRTGVWVSFDDGVGWQVLEGDSTAGSLPRSGVNDLLVKGSDLVAATQGRALWILDNLTPLRALAAAGRTSLPGAEVKLVAPAAAVRLAVSENRDTPLPPEIPTTANPPTGAVIDYLLPSEAGAVTVDVLAADGAVVRHFASDEPRERAKARQYFHDRWLRPLPVPSKRAGHNRFVWDLRLPQPQATGYGFGIAATLYDGTPTLPQGALVLPGRYTLRLSVDGVVREQPLEVVADPRSAASAADLATQAAFTAEVTRLLERVAATASSAKGLEDWLAPIADGTTKGFSGGQRRRAGEHLAKIQPLRERLEALGDDLTSLVGDLEAADGPPTAPQRALLAETAPAAEEALAALRRATVPLSGHTIR